MNGRSLAVPVACLAGLFAAGFDRPTARADDPPAAVRADDGTELRRGTRSVRIVVDDGAVTVTTGPDGSDDGEQDRRAVPPAKVEWSEIREGGSPRLFAAADLLAARPGTGPALKDHESLLSFVRATAGASDGAAIDWLDRRQIVRVRGDAALAERVKQRLASLRNYGTGRLRVARRLMSVPTSADVGPPPGRAAVLSPAEVDRVVESHLGRSPVRGHHARGPIPDGEILFVYTSDDPGDESSHRGLNVAFRAAPDGRGATLTAYPFRGDEGKAQWPDLFVAVGATAAYDVPPLTARHSGFGDPGHAADRVLVLFTVDEVTPSAE